MAANNAEAALARVPNATVYVRNIEERVKIEPDLVNTLRELFEDYGNIVEIIAKSSVKRKGQAFIVFDDPASAAQAIEDINGFDLYGKPLQLALARNLSDATVKRKCTDEEFEHHKRQRLMDKERKQAQQAAQEQQKKPGTDKKPRTVKTGVNAIPDEYLPPNKTLLVANIPPEVTQDDLIDIFEKFPGFKEVRHVAIRNLAFVEYEDAERAIPAKDGASQARVGPEQKTMKITFQRQ